MSLVVLVAAACLADPQPLPPGKGVIEVTIQQTPLQVFTYRPDSYREGPLILVFHGILRNAEEYRDHAVGMGERFGALIAAPLFDDVRFPKRRYQQAGVLDDHGRPTPPDQRTAASIPDLVDEIRRREQRPDLKYYLIGHSAGGQFLVRSAAFVSTGATRIVAANPGTHLFPRKDADYPLGFAGLPDNLATDEQLRHYLAQPLTLYLGSADTERDEFLDVSPESDRQGQNRWDRGHNAFAAARQLAAEKGWKFGWRLVVADGVGHDHQQMFDHQACQQALFGD